MQNIPQNINFTSNKKAYVGPCPLKVKYNSFFNLTIDFQKEIKSNFSILNFRSFNNNKQIPIEITANKITKNTKEDIDIFDNTLYCDYEDSDKIIEITVKNKITKEIIILQYGPIFILEKFYQIRNLIKDKPIYHNIRLHINKKFEINYKRCILTQDTLNLIKTDKEKNIEIEIYRISKLFKNRTQPYVFSFSYNNNLYEVEFGSFSEKQALFSLVNDVYLQRFNQIKSSKLINPDILRGIDEQYKELKYKQYNFYEGINNKINIMDLRASEIKKKINHFSNSFRIKLLETKNKYAITIDILKQENINLNKKVIKSNELQELNQELKDNYEVLENSYINLKNKYDNIKNTENLKEGYINNIKEHYENEYKAEINNYIIKIEQLETSNLNLTNIIHNLNNKYKKNIKNIMTRTRKTYDSKLELLENDIDNYIYEYNNSLFKLDNISELRDNYSNKINCFKLEKKNFSFELNEINNKFKLELDKINEEKANTEIINKKLKQDIDILNNDYDKIMNLNSQLNNNIKELELKITEYENNNDKSLSIINSVNNYNYCNNIIKECEKCNINDIKYRNQLIVNNKNKYNKCNYNIIDKEYQKHNINDIKYNNKLIPPNNEDNYDYDNIDNEEVDKNKQYIENNLDNDEVNDIKSLDESINNNITSNYELEKINENDNLNDNEIDNIKINNDNIDNDSKSDNDKSNISSNNKADDIKDTNNNNIEDNIDNNLKNNNSNIEYDNTNIIHDIENNNSNIKDINIENYSSNNNNDIKNDIDNSIDKLKTSNISKSDNNEELTINNNTKIDHNENKEISEDNNNDNISEDNNNDNIIQPKESSIIASEINYDKDDNNNYISDTINDANDDNIISEINKSSNIKISDFNYSSNKNKEGNNEDVNDELKNSTCFRKNTEAIMNNLLNIANSNIIKEKEPKNEENNIRKKVSTKIINGHLYEYKYTEEGEENNEPFTELDTHKLNLLSNKSIGITNNLAAIHNEKKPSKFSAPTYTRPIALQHSNSKTTIESYTNINTANEYANKLYDDINNNLN